MIPKIRAWDTHEDVMNRVDYIDFANGVVSLSNENVKDYEQPIHRVKFMQYTGLKDKNGVDVFEGDYLSWISFESHKEFKGEVVFSKGSFCMVVGLKGHNYKVPLHELSDSDNLIEVLGNIYENPELLEVPND